MSDADDIEQHQQKSLLPEGEEELRLSTPHPREHAPLLKPISDDIDSLQATQEEEDLIQLSLSKLSDENSANLDDAPLYTQQSEKAADDHSSVDSRHHTANSVHSELSKIKINYAPVWKPGFQNRRNQSAYLKNAFPAGYQLAKVRSQLSGNHYDHIMKKAEILGKSASKSHLSNSDRFSFVDWTKGSGSFELSADDDELSDPYADCAGPLLIELQRARKALKPPSFDYIPQDPACIVKKMSLKPPSVPLKSSNNSASNKSIGNSTMLSTEKSSSQSKIFHAPSLLPTLNPSLSTSNPFMITNNRKSSAYDQWILDRRSNSNEKTWKYKGNDHTHNYSAYSFNGSAEVIRTNPSLSTLPAVPTPWLVEMIVEVYTINQIMRAASTVDDHDQILVLTVPCEATLQEIRHTISNEIVEGIRKAFPELPKLLNAPHKDIAPIQVDHIEMIFQYFNYDVQAWRPLQHEADWIQTKDYISNQSGQVLKLLYALEPQSEQLLLRQIQKNYELQKEALATKNPHISLQELTECVFNSDKKKLRRAQSEPSPSRTKLKPLPPSTKNVLFGAEQSVLYPKSSQKLKDMQQKAIELTNRFDSYAINLESKILKTRF